MLTGGLRETAGLQLLAGGPSPPAQWKSCPGAAAWAPPPFLRRKLWRQRDVRTMTSMPGSEMRKPRGLPRSHDACATSGFCRVGCRGCQGLAANADVAERPGGTSGGSGRPGNRKRGPARERSRGSSGVSDRAGAAGVSAAGPGWGVSLSLAERGPGSARWVLLGGRTPARPARLSPPADRSVLGP